MTGLRRWACRLMAPLLLLSLAPGIAAQGRLDERDVELLGAPQGRPLSDAELERATEEVTSLMRCPVCQGLSVADSHTPLALAMGAKAEALLEAGYSSDQVLGYFESSYGEFIRLSPRPEGFNLVVWILPGVGLLVGLLLIWYRLRRRPETQPVAAADDGEMASYRERVRREAGL